MKFISEENYKKLTQDKQLGYLDKYIKGGNSKDKIKLFTLEVGRCKSVLSSFSMVEGCLDNNIKYIYVVKNNELANEALDRINEYCEEKKRNHLAIFLNAENKQDEIKNIEKYPILIITHARYINCCTDKEQKRLICNGRNTLIIDEEIQIFQPIKYDLQTYEWFFTTLGTLSPSIAIQYNKVMSGILNCLYTYKGKMVYNCNKRDYNSYKKELSKLKNMIDTLDASIINKLEIEDVRKKQCILLKSDLLNECCWIENFYTHTAYFENGSLFTYDNRYDFWLLGTNNILLDASGHFLYTYKISDTFNVNGTQNRITDRSNWIINFCNLNTTTKAKERMVNLYEEVEKHINLIMNEGDKLLIAGKKNLDDTALENVINGENIQYGYYGNLVGHNTWKDFNKFYSILTFQMPSYVYVVKYLFYSKKKITNKTNMNGINDGKGKNKVYRFFNSDLEKVRVTTIVSELYQSIGRIARVGGIDADIYLLLNDEDIKDLIIKQFKNIRIKEFDLEVEIMKKEREYNNINRVIEGKQGDFMRLILEIKKGKYADIVTVDKENKTLIVNKKDIVDIIKIDTKKFKERILDKPIVVNFLENNNIIIKTRQIIIPY